MIKLNLISIQVLISIVMLPVLSGCFTSKELSSSETLTYTRHDEPADIRRFFTPEKPFAISTHADALISLPFVRIIEHNGIYYSLDRLKKKVICFDNTGRITGVIEALGGGNLEYSRISDISWCDYTDGLLLLCDNKLLFAGKDGKIIDSKPLPTYYDCIASTSDHIYLVNSQKVNGNNADYCITILDKAGKLKETLPNNNSSFNCIVNGLKISRQHGKIWYSANLDPRIFQISATGEYTVPYAFDWGDYLCKAENERDIDCESLVDKCRKEGKIFSVSEFQEGNKYISMRSNLINIVIASKNDSLVESYKYLYDYEGMVGLPGYTPVENSDGRVFFCMDPNYYPTFAKLSQNKELIDRIDSIKPESNPIIFPYIIK